MVKKSLIEQEKWEEITAISAEAVRMMLGYTLKHVGVNCQDETEAVKAAQLLCQMFGMEYRPGNSSVFAGTAVEFNKKPGRGTHGHIAIGVNNVDRAVYHLSRLGVSFDESSRRAGANGQSKLIYLSDEIAGFALHLVLN